MHTRSGLQTCVAGRFAAATPHGRHRPEAVWVRFRLLGLRGPTSFQRLGSVTAPGRRPLPAPKVYGAKPSTPSRDSSPVLTGIIAGMGAGVLWALIAYLTHYAFGWGAVGLGALVGLAVRKAAGQGNPSHGITAAALATGALVFGKLLIHMFALQPMIEDEMLGNQEAVNVAYFLDMAHRRAFSPELQAALPQGGMVGFDAVVGFGAAPAARAHAAGGARQRQEGATH